MTTSVTYHTFLSYRSEDRPTVLPIADQLKKRGCDCFLDQWYLVPGQNWVEGLERALHGSQSVVIFVGPTEEMGRWQQRERAWALDRQTREKHFPVIPVLLPGCEPPLGFLSLLMWIDLRENLADSNELDRLAAVIRGETVDETGQRRSRNMICPYRGLQYFREEDASFFFGRDTYIEQLTDKVGRHNLVAVVGASGSGKSSVVRAGLLPKLRAPDTKAVWEIVTMVPRTAPLFSLANELLPLLEPELSRYDRVSQSERAARDLKANEVSLRNLMTAVLDQQKGTDRLLLVVDQWEELYTQCGDAEEREQFIRQILDATSGDRSPLTVLLTVRADFYHRLLQDRELLDQLQDGKVDLGPMTREELRDAIEKPAAAVGLTFQPGLVDRLLSDAREEPGRLPLLEYALDELWKLRDGTELTHGAYEAFGGLSGAISSRAEALFDEKHEEETKRLFQSLVNAGSKPDEDTRRRADLRSFDEPTRLIAHRLAEHRLLVTTRTTETDVTDEGGVETVEVAHETLLRSWSRLRRWIDEEREFLQWRARLGPLLEQYRHDADSALLRGRALEEARRHYNAKTSQLDAAEKAFLEASFRVKRRERQWKVGGAILAVTLMLAVILSFQHSNNRVAVRSAINGIGSTTPTAVPTYLEALQRLPSYASDQLQLEYEKPETNPQHKLRFAYGLIAVGAVTSVDDEVARFVIQRIADTPGAESANLVQALRTLSERDNRVHEQVRRHISSDASDEVQTRYRVAALSLGDPKSSELLDAIRIQDGDPSRRTLFIRDFAAWPGDVERICELAAREDDSEIRSALCLALGGVAADTRSESEHQNVEATMKPLYRGASDSGSHSAAGWALREWGKIVEPEIARCKNPSEREAWPEDRSWFVNSMGMTMAKIDAGTYPVGSDDGFDNNPRRDEDVMEYWISTGEVTVEQFLELIPAAKSPQILKDAQTPAGRWGPVSEVTWYDAVKFCNLLSKREGLELCYEIREEVRDDEHRFIEQAQVKFLVEKNGYRLPNDLEWEIACRAGTSSVFSFGDDDAWMIDYGWSSENAYNQAHPVASKRPNPWGLFDMHGNVEEWCDVVEGSLRVIRGGGWYDPARDARSAVRFRVGPSLRSDDLGFRLASSPLDRRRPEFPNGTDRFPVRPTTCFGWRNLNPWPLSAGRLPDGSSKAPSGHFCSASCISHETARTSSGTWPGPRRFSELSRIPLNATCRPESRPL